MQKWGEERTGKGTLLFSEIILKTARKRKCFVFHFKIVVSIGKTSQPRQYH